MSTLLEITNALTDKVKKALADSEFSKVPIVEEDLSKSIIRPSIKIILDDGNSKKINSSMKEQTLHCRVYFFAGNLENYKAENLKVRSLIENEFLSSLKISDSFSADIDEVVSETSDTVLICSFDIETLEEIPELILDDGIEYELMENLNLNMKSEE